MRHINAIVFDLYGTLFDVHSVAARCETFFPQRGRELSLLWRQKQLEYTWLRSVMGRYENFERVTEDALRFTCGQLKLDLNDDRERMLLEDYLRLSPFPEVPDALQQLRLQGLPLAILSNGSAHSIDAVVHHSGLKNQFAHLISVDEVRVFKPHSKVYELAERRLKLSRQEILFVSSNAWDATGARHFGYPVCWVDRAGNTFEELGQRPDHTVQGLDQLAAIVAANRRGD